MSDKNSCRGIMNDKNIDNNKNHVNEPITEKSIKPYEKPTLTPLPKTDIEGGGSNIPEGNGGSINS